MNPLDFQDVVCAVFFLKWCSDQFDARFEEIVGRQLAKGIPRAEAEKRANHPSFYLGSVFVPEKARWSFLRDEVHQNVGEGLNAALAALEHANASLDGVLVHIDFTRGVHGETLSDKQLINLVTSLSELRFINEDREHPHLVGDAFDGLLGWMTRHAGREFGSRYTPRSVAQLMVRLLDLKEGVRVYDPCAGFGDMLVLSKEYLDERRLKSENLGLYGQELNQSLWSIGQMNMLLHGIHSSDVRNRNTLAAPQHTEGGDLMRFDRVISNPPPSTRYNKEDVTFPERFRFGWCTGSNGRTGLMYLQHALAALRHGGRVVTILPVSALTSIGPARRIRSGILNEDLLDAVIGLGPKLSRGHGISPSILVLRAPDAKPKARKGKVLFIDARREFARANRAENILLPEHLNRIVAASDSFATIPGFARVVSREELKRIGDNLDVRGVFAHVQT